ncbi:MAG TPA: DoxX family protein [Luteimonas sp.]|nr:DoxX family protein [Luteimonas sp.]
MNHVAIAAVQAALGATFAWILLAVLRGRTDARGLARGFLLACVLLALGNLLGVAAVSLGGDATASAVRPALRLLRLADWPLTGIAIVLAGIAAVGRHGTDAPSPASAFAFRPETVAGLSVYVALGFFAFEIGKAAHDAEMRQFFLSSGLPVWFMYAVMAAEIAGAVGLMFERSRPYAALWLAAIMVGAIGTHVRNGDPFSDSLDALRMLLVTLSIFALYRRNRSPG